MKHQVVKNNINIQYIEVSWRFVPPEGHGWGTQSIEVKGGGRNTCCDGRCSKLWFHRMKTFMLMIFLFLVLLWCETYVCGNLLIDGACLYWKDGICFIIWPIMFFFSLYIDRYMVPQQTFSAIMTVIKKIVLFHMLDLLEVHHSGSSLSHS